MSANGNGPESAGAYQPQPLTVTGERGAVRFDGQGLVPVVVLDSSDGTLLMLAYADREAVDLTLETGQAHYFSRSRQELWRKGATSGHVQRVDEVALDCDGDALVYRVRQTGPACHTGEQSCFHRPLAHGEPAGSGTDTDTDTDTDMVAGTRAIVVTGSGAGTERPATERSVVPTSLGEVLELLERVVIDRLATLPPGSYVGRLHERGIGYVAQKVIEEAGETVVAALEHKDEELHGEAADLLFHLSVLLAERGVSWSDVAGVLLARHAASSTQ